MPILLLSRPKPLTPAEAKALPTGCVAGDGKDGVVARAEVHLPINQLLGYAVAMARAVPDAMFLVQDEGVSLQKTPPPAAAREATAPQAAAPEEVITETDGWKLFDAGKRREAERVFAAGNGLDGEGRERCRRLLISADAEDVAFGCRVARITDWKSASGNLRNLVRHAHPSVRRDAAEAIGALAGPSMSMVLRPLLTDPDAEVREAAKAATAKLGG